MAVKEKDEAYIDWVVWFWSDEWGWISNMRWERRNRRRRRVVGTWRYRGRCRHGFNIKPSSLLVIYTLSDISAAARPMKIDPQRRNFIHSPKGFKIFKFQAHLPKKMYYEGMSTQSCHRKEPKYPLTKPCKSHVRCLLAVTSTKS